MAATSAPGSRRRSGPPALHPGPPPDTGHPPSKRARAFPVATPLDPEDQFGAHGELTADDLEELDILASQALSQCPAAARDLSSECRGPSPGGRCRPPAPLESKALEPQRALPRGLGSCVPKKSFDWGGRYIRNVRQPI